ncbi:hypothetical protein SAMN04489859_10834 [Paracoccus alcaliphilus]|uniref:Uncharacterized protein n=1 Tax=Paracoccus alcaliphilus TaxID=34002 RepID=A0A1H8P724_9RHOB|nr:hypothetical protein [Paracoccus alcaliphilus]WCR20893.1 hypothetical protein JHW40_23195 [Paracoccus alcaliphilus]SEO37730.1 hypothetical protein SAMN04489859_10834 [Paracoccus alcaliphilus]
MANAAHTTPIEATEGLPHPGSFTDTVITNSFSRLLDALASLIGAERDIADVDVWDPAYRPWLTDAEHAHQLVTDLLRVISDTHPQHAVDLPLIRMSSAIHMLLGSEAPHELHHALRLIQDPQFDADPDHGETDWHIQELILIAQDRAMELASLDPYQSHDDPDPELDIWPDPLAA